MSNESILIELKQALNKSSGASFYKCALQVNSSSYANYRGQNPMFEDEYNQLILDNCQKQDIQVVGLADHSDVERSEKLRNFLVENGIHVFPGFEICSQEKVHMVCLFPKNFTTIKLAGILGSVNYNPNRKKDTDPSNKGLIDIAKEVFEYGGVWYAAHMTGDCGLLKLNKDGGGLSHIWRQEKWVLAGQIPGKRDELEQNYLQIIDNKNPDYKRENLVSLINASDVCVPEDLLRPSSHCLVKMTKPSVEALKQAFLDGDSRIRRQDEIPEHHQSQLMALSVSGGGFLDGMQIHFSENLNALIGGRGTGKSTILEGIRYALDLEPKSQEAKKTHDEIIRKNFKDSRILLNVYSNRQGKTYIVERQTGQPHNIYDDSGNLTHQTIRDILPGIEILGQNEINDIAKERARQLDLLKRFLPLDLPDIGNLLKKLGENRSKLVLAIDKKEEVESEVNQMQRLKEQQSSFRQFGLQQKFVEADTYEKEKNRIIQRNASEIEIIDVAVRNLTDSLNSDLHYLSNEAVKDLINKDLIEQIRSEFEKFLKDALKPLGELQNLFEGFKQRYGMHDNSWQKRNETFERDLKKLIEKLPDMAGKNGKQVADEYLKITRKLNAIQQSATQLQQHQNHVSELQKERKGLLAELENSLHDQFEALNKAVKKLNKGPLKDRLRVTVDKTADRKELKDFLKAQPGLSDAKVEWVDQVEQLTIRALCETIDKGREHIISSYGANGIKESVVKLLAGLSVEDRLRLDEIIFHPEPVITLNVNHKPMDEAFYRPIEDLSTGQKCTAILHLLLLENDDKAPLLIDQPEDNLDNAFIADQIVEDLRKSKVKRQFIFSTHNANIPVFGDAEWMGVLEADQEHAYLSDNNTGSIDSQELKEKVEDILEGGKKAFEIRRLKYGF